jgi:hypothetical protein
VTREPRRRAIGMELAGVAGAVVLGLVGLAHVAISGRAFFLFFDGDSQLLPLMRQAVLDGGPLHFALSTGLAFPELALYLACAAFATSVQGAIAINAVVDVVILYALVRVIAGQVAPNSGRARRIGLAVGSMALFTLLLLFQSGREDNTFELLSMTLTGAYYLASVVGTVATVALTMVAVRRSGRRHLGPAIGIALVAVVSVGASPIYIAWSVIPMFVVLAGLVLLRRVHWRTAIVPAAAVVIGTILGLLVRIPLAPFITADPLSYVHVLQIRTSLAAFAHSVIDTVQGSATGFLTIVGLVVMVVLSIVATIVAIRRRVSIAVLGLTAFASVTSIVVIVGAVVLGQNATRYLLPAAFLPVLTLPAVIVMFRWDRLLVVRRRAVAIGAAVLLAIGVIVAPASAIGAVQTVRYTSADCLDRWLDGRDLVGAGEYWATRSMNVYDPQAHILQIVPTATSYIWLVDLDQYRVDAVSYVVVDDPAADAGWGASLTGAFGAPAQVVRCSGYQIYDYVGTAGEPLLTKAIVDSADAERVARGW